jgi:hypothetical protein
MLSQGKTLVSRLSTFQPVLLIILILGFLLASMSCGGGGGGLSGTPEPPPTLTTAVQVKIGDASCDRLLSVEASLDAMHLIDDKGTSINILPSSRRLEFTHLAGTSQLIAQLKIPQATYTKAVVDGANLHVTYMDSLRQWHEYTFNGTAHFEVTLPPLVIAAATTVVTVDFDLAKSIVVDPYNQVPPSIAPVFTLSTAAVKTSGEQEPEDGALENVVGLVQSVSGNSFTMNLDRDNFTAAFNTNSSTVFENATLSTLPNLLVKVNGVTQSDGSLLATEVEAWADQNGSEIEGIVTNYFNYITSAGIIVLAQDGVGAGFMPYDETMGAQARGATLGAVYAVNTDGMDMTGINFGFDPNKVALILGQRVRLYSDTGFNRADPQYNDQLTAQKVTLEKQTVTGVVANYTPGTRPHFDLQLSPDTYLGVSVAHVYQQEGTHLRGITAIGNGDTVYVRGLLFQDQTGFHMVAQRIWQ